MPVPDFQSIMLPLLRIAGDGNEHALAEARGRLSAEFKLTQAEQDELLSGRQSRFANRVAWAKVYLDQGGLLLKMGYGGSRADAGQAVGKSGDEGIDGIVSEDRLGLDIVYLQAKRWEGSVGRPEIQRFVGALHGKRAKKGVFITTGSFSSDAVAYVEHIDPKVVLIDGRRLAAFMLDFEVGVTTARTFRVKRVDSDYFEEG